MEEYSSTIAVGEGQEKGLLLLGAGDRNLRLIRDELDVRISAREGSITIEGKEARVKHAARALEALKLQVKAGKGLDESQVMTAIRGTRGGELPPEHLAFQEIEVYTSGRSIRARTPGQENYVKAIRNNDLTFCTGPAGTGKTYLAVAVAVAMLKAGLAKRMVLVRPAVEAGEKLGFLPGDIQAKVNPYLRPLLDALHDMMSFEQIKRFMLNDVIEIIPLAYMRGRTLNDAIVILDEAQNTTPGQMVMFLTRLGQRSKMIVTGDVTQVDLPAEQTSGLIDAAERLRSIRGIALVALGKRDIVRHRLVEEIVLAYGK